MISSTCDSLFFVLSYAIFCFLNSRECDSSENSFIPTRMENKSHEHVARNLIDLLAEHPESVRINLHFTSVCKY